MTPIILLAVANLIMLLLVIMTMSDVKKLQGLVNALMVIAYTNLRKEGKTTGDLLNDIIEVANEMAKKEGTLL